MQNSVVVLILCFRLETNFFGRFGPINQNWQFELKFGTQTNTIMKNNSDNEYPF